MYYCIAVMSTNFSECQKGIYNTQCTIYMHVDYHSYFSSHSPDCDFLPVDTVVSTSRRIISAAW